MKLKFEIPQIEEYGKRTQITNQRSMIKLGLSNSDERFSIRMTGKYIKGWASALRDNQKWIMLAAARAEKSADYILGIESSYSASEEKTTAEVTREVPVKEPVLEDSPF